MAEPEILKAARRFKLSLIRQNDVALREMERTYMAAWKRLKRDLDAVTAQIEAARKAGKQAVVRGAGSKVALKEGEFSANWLFRQGRYQELMYQLEVEIARYSRYAAAMVGRQQEFGLGAGGDDARNLMSQSLGPVPDGLRGVVTVQWNRVPHEALQNLVGFLADGSPLEYKFAGLSEVVKQGIRETLTTGIAAGWNPRKTAREVEKAYKGAMFNSLVTCRTETLRAYRQASMANYRANDDVCTGWIWTAARSPRTCAGCIGRDGSWHPLDEDLVDHVAGRCVAVVTTRPWSELVPGAKLKGIKETSAQPWEPEEWFGKLSVGNQIKAIGPARYRLWRDGKVSLRDLAERRGDKVWGYHYAPKRIKTLVKEGKITAEEARAAQAPRPSRARKATSLAQALKFPIQTNAVLDAAKDAVAAIGRVHSTGKLPQIGLRYGPAGGGNAYGHYDRPGKPTEIVIGDFQGMLHDHPRVTAVHEVGHFLDDQGIGKPGSLASRTKALDKWWNAVDNTDAIKRIRQKRAAATGLDRQMYLDYLLSREETFARSYAQYIATKSANPGMLAEIRKMRKLSGEDLKVWTQKDFRPVQRAFDELLRGLGWVQ